MNKIKREVVRKRRNFFGENSLRQVLTNQQLNIFILLCPNKSIIKGIDSNTIQIKIWNTINLEYTRNKMN